MDGSTSQIGTKSLPTSLRLAFWNFALVAITFVAVAPSKFASWNYSQSQSMIGKKPSEVSTLRI